MNAGTSLEQMRKISLKPRDCLVHIHVDPFYDELAFTLLLEKGLFIKCLSNNEYIIESSSLKILDDMKMTYNLIEGFN